MAQHDYSIANGTGSAVRSDLNNALAAIVSMNSGSTEPSTTFAFQFWADTNANLLKMRNSANDGWIELRQLDGEFTSLGVENGTNAAPSIFFRASGTDTGLWSSGTDSVDIATAGSNRFSVGSTGDVTVRGGNVNLNGQGDLRFLDADSSNWVSFQAPATVASNVTWTLPSADGTSGQALSTNGSGTLSWSSVGGDKIEEGNTSAEVVDTGSDGHFKVTTEGTEQLRLNAGGDLTLGETAPFGGTVANRRHLTLDAVSDVKIQLGVGGTERQYVYGDNTNLSIVNTQNGYVRINTNNTERLRVANSGAFGLSGGNYGTSGQVLTSQGSGSAPQWATPAGGKILQVVHERYSNITSVSCNSNNPTQVGVINATITPSSTSSTILVSYSVMHDWSANNCAYEGMFNLYRGGNDASQNPSPAAAPGSRNLGLVPGVVTQAGSDNPKVAILSNYSDSPASTSALTYYVYVKQTVGSTQTLYINRLASDTNNSNYERGVSWMTLMEVQG